ncbi:hypothetical protein PU629_02615 [Pullulanibacillus sp. KACC 23026]|uniref:hypothetical protein n=1 Tax=Pullulanibacillus sp. KACC 23026 TaxID=3028315 RepID=UPI0023AF982E|nr:hypothetical protein [Pullulanibacillus sp. KACC 23026]WEG13276.1 hypothetical protein PU629_02615 [Pullulanibacillus sp. KACC 23026]
MLSPSTNIHKAKWLMDKLYPFESYLAGSVIPEGFEAYARILHPATSLKDGQPVTWAEIAQWSGRIYHPEMQFESIGTPIKGKRLAEKPWDGQLPYSMPNSQLKALANLLAPFTQTPDSIWCLVWEGRVGQLKKTGHPLVSKPNRRYYLFNGCIHDLGSDEFEKSRCEPPEYWFPEDKAWCVATDMDIFWTYVGGSYECVDSILHSRQLESVPAKLRSGLTVESDRINSLTDAERAMWQNG